MAPTPVSALLHAVAVVKGGVFALMRVVYWCFGAGFLIGTKVQAAVLCVCCITILYGSLSGPLHPASETQAGLFYCKPAVLYPYGPCL